MSLLPATSHANPTTPFWASASGGGGGGAQSVAGTVGGTQSSTLTQNAETTLNTFSQVGAGTYVITASFQWVTGVNATQMVGRIYDNTSTTYADAIVTQPSGVSSQGYSASCVLTIPNTTGIDVQQIVIPSSTGCTCLAQWSILFFPYTP